MRPFLPATADFASGKHSAREFLERCIADLDAWEPKIGAFVTLNLAGARTAADRSSERWRAGKPLSPIDGMPIGIKDIIETIDMATENVRRFSPVSAASATALALRLCARPGL
jgi:Asp-tRNA(Asn)/Glu-tRNA(Gln) amidotransferase A subunit family amidase